MKHFQVNGELIDGVFVSGRKVIGRRIMADLLPRYLGEVHTAADEASILTRFLIAMVGYLSHDTNYVVSLLT